MSSSTLRRYRLNGGLPPSQHRQRGGRKFAGPRGMGCRRRVVLSSRPRLRRRRPRWGSLIGADWRSATPVGDANGQGGGPLARRRQLAPALVRGRCVSTTVPVAGHAHSSGVLPSESATHQNSNRSGCRSDAPRRSGPARILQVGWGRRDESAGAKVAVTISLRALPEPFVDRLVILHGLDLEGARQVRTKPVSDTGRSSGSSSAAAEVAASSAGPGIQMPVGCFVECSSPSEDSTPVCLVRAHQPVANFQSAWDQCRIKCALHDRPFFQVGFRQETGPRTSGIPR